MLRRRGSILGAGKQWNLSLIMVGPSWCVSGSVLLRLRADGMFDRLPSFSTLHLSVSYES